MHNVKKEETLDILQSLICVLSPERFDRLIQRGKYLKVNTKDRLSGPIQLILEKVMSEPGYCATYAKFCRILVDMNTASEGGDTSLNFLELLLQRYQQEFLKDIGDGECSINQEKELNFAEKNEDEHQHLESEVDGPGSRTTWTTNNCPQVCLSGL